MPKNVTRFQPAENHIIVLIRNMLYALNPPKSPTFFREEPYFRKPGQLFTRFT